MQKTIASLVVLAALAIGAVACSSSSDSGGSSGTAGTSGSAGSSGSSGSSGTAGTGGGDVAAGKALADANVCTSCHGADYAGSPSGRNITPSTSAGIGSWSDAEIEAAITAGIRKDGVALCASMQMYPFDSTQVANIVAFLKSNPAVDTVNAGPCPH